MKVNNEACATETHLKMFMGEGRSQRSIVGRSVRLWAGQPRVKIPVGTRDFLFFINAQCGSGVHPSSNSVWCSQGLSGQVMKLSTHFCLVPRIRMSGTLPLLLPYAFMALTERTLPFHLLCVKVLQNEKIPLQVYKQESH